MVMMVVGECCDYLSFLVLIVLWGFIDPGRLYPRVLVLLGVCGAPNFWGCSNMAMRFMSLRVCAVSWRLIDFHLPLLGPRYLTDVFDLDGVE
jgi:hypothetical protein